VYETKHWQVFINWHDR